MTSLGLSEKFEAVCRMRVNKGGDDSSESQRFVSLVDCPGKSTTRMQWALQISRRFNEYPEPHDTIRSWDFILNLDGSVDSISTQPLNSSYDRVYPAQYRIPPHVVAGIGRDIAIKRAEMFALGGLLYELAFFTTPFAHLSDDEVESRYAMGDVPEVVWSMQHPLCMSILKCWNSEFSMDVEKLGFATRLGKHIKENPITFGLQALGGTAFAASLIAVPVLGFVGFSAAGPVAGSAAAAWQASVGFVEAGTLFAWCQSAAMGGAALNGIFALGATGAGVMGVSSLQGGTKPGVPELKEVFKKAFEKCETKEQAKAHTTGQSTSP